MTQPPAEQLTSLRVGNQSLLLTFYQQNRDHFARWVRRHHNVEATPAHELLRTVLLDFFDQVADGRLAKMPPDLRAYLYGMARERLDSVPATSSTQEGSRLPEGEVARRQRVLQLFSQLGTDCQQVLMYFYFRGYNFEKVAGKMGYANATVARLQKAGCLRKFYEQVTRPVA
ncbi:hypothetical protein LJY25_04425 [Hymenobacter sp. BT175]|uniref:hypothetical protein n=1 Tax=Hymenobacter translucens TaxID=2886507 RepID=UPI001D0DC153|nr:hypothetical protein [Hymenobacter translucens]MCC2545680.1 hypothetical protein [Hymenobacter translucens]